VSKINILFHLCQKDC